ncbi:MAG: flagellar basal body L-ring protein FlgH, partial [Shewanella sp.]
MRRYLLLGRGVLALLGCASTQQKPIADDPFYAPVYPDAP